MAEEVAAQDTRLARAATFLFLAATGIRSLAAIIAGFVEWHDSANTGLPEGRFRAGDVLTTFGAGGDTAGILLVVCAAAAVWWCLRVGDVDAARLRVAVNWAFAVVVAANVASAVGVGLIDSLGSRSAHTVEASGFALANVIVAIGVIKALQRYGAAVDQIAFEEDDSGIEAFVFAVDRKSGDVRAFLSVRQAARGMHIYWVEDDEFVFYTDEGVVLDASVVDQRIVFHLTETIRRDQLLSQLREFVTRRGIKVDSADEDDPAAYAVPIARWQGLELWPPWLRPLGLLFQPRG
jgi:hypothetical protein